MQSGSPAGLGARMWALKNAEHCFLRKQSDTQTPCALVGNRSFTFLHKHTCRGLGKTMRQFGIRLTGEPVRKALRSNKSTVALSISAAGLLIFRLAAFACMLWLLGAGIFVVFAAEPLWMRLLTFLVMGLVPSVACVVGGGLTYWLLHGASAVYDRALAKTILVLQIMLTKLQPVLRFTSNILIKLTKPALLLIDWLDLGMGCILSGACWAYAMAGNAWKLATVRSYQFVQRTAAFAVWRYSPR